MSGKGRYTSMKFENQYKIRLQAKKTLWLCKSKVNAAETKQDIGKQDSEEFSSDIICTWRNINVGNYVIR